MEAFAHTNAIEAAHAVRNSSRTRLNDLERAIYSTIAYRDMFDFAPTLEEIHRFLHWVRCDRADVARALGQAPLSSQIATDGAFYALRDRAHLVALRPDRQELLQRVWPLTLRYGRYLANLPHVRMVGITGSVAARNVKADYDIDFMVLTEAGTMWRTRALARVSAVVDAKFGGKLCPNFFLSMAAMSLDRRSLYDAHELAQLVPIYGRDVYDQLRRANGWTDAFLPNACGAPNEEDSYVRPRFAGLKAVVEWGSRSPLGRALENFEARRKIYRFNETDRLKGQWTKSTFESHSLRDHVRQEIEAAWRQRMDMLAATET
jgi:hypothetical protein